MPNYDLKAEKNKSKALANGGISANQKSSKPIFQLEDNRPEGIAQLKIMDALSASVNSTNAPIQTWSWGKKKEKEASKTDGAVQDGPTGSPAEALINDSPVLEKEADVMGQKAQAEGEQKLDNGAAAPEGNTGTQDADEVKTDALSTDEVKSPATDVPEIGKETDPLTAEKEKKKEDKKAENKKAIIEGGRLGLGNPASRAKDKVKEIVVDVQNLDVEIKNSEPVVIEDAAINAYLLQESKKAGKDAAKQQTVSELAKEVLTDKFAKTIAPNNAINEGKLEPIKTTSFVKAKDFKRKSTDASMKKAEVEMLYNLMEKMGADWAVEEKKRKAGKGFFEDKPRTPEQEKMVTESVEVFDIADKNKDAVTETKDELVDYKKELAGSGRIAGWKDGLGTKVANAAFSGALSFVTMGLATTKQKFDKRGISSDKSFSLDLESENGDASMDLDDSVTKGGFSIETPVDKFRTIQAEFDNTLATRKGKGLDTKLSYFSLVMDAGRKFIGVAKDIISAIGLFFTALAIIPGAQAMAVVSAICATINHYLTMVQGGMVAIKLILDGIIQMTNKNPALFAELRGATAKSGMDLATQSASFATSTVGKSAASGQGATKDSVLNPSGLTKNPDEMNANGALHGIGVKAAPTLSTGRQIAGGAVGAIAPALGAVNGGLSDKGSMVNNKRFNTGAKGSNAAFETKSIMAEAFEASKAKGAKLAAGLENPLKSVSGKRPPAPKTTPKMDQEQSQGATSGTETINQTQETANDMRDVTKDMTDSLVT